MEFENVLPSEIEKRSFEIIESELPHDIEKTIKPIVKRVIHTTADFDYLDNLCFSENVVEIIKNAIKNGADIVTDTQMARSGINKKRLASYGGEVHCFMSDEDVAKAAKENGTTRAVASMEKASKLEILSFTILFFRALKILIYFFINLISNPSIYLITICCHHYCIKSFFPLFINNTYT